MTSETFFWVFVAFQVVIDLYVASVVIFWILQRRKYGTFNPLSPFQHRELQIVRDVLDEFRAISQKAASLMQHLHQKQKERVADVAPTKITAAPVAQQPAQPAPTPPRIVRPVAPSAGLDRHQQILTLIRQGASIPEIRSQTGASQEEIHLIQTLQ